MEGLCGPSNALQNFQKHSVVDRTLQQDRLTSRPSPSQGFRSSGPSAGVLDPEFAAFQNGQALSPHPEAQGFDPRAFSNSYAPQQLQQAGPASWATDFQQMNISSPLPQLQHRVQDSQMAGGWHQEFAQHQSQQPGPSFSHQTNYAAPIAAVPRTFQPMYNSQMYGNSQSAFMAHDQQVPLQQADGYDEEAFAQAFDAAVQSELASEQGQHQNTEPEVMLNESAEQLLGPEEQRIGADMIYDPRQEGDNIQQDDQDAISRTAAHLLDRVKDNKSDKFQNSMFLGLMRQLRDKEVMVEGDKIVGVGHSGEEAQVVTS